MPSSLLLTVVLALPPAVAQAATAEEDAQIAGLADGASTAVVVGSGVGVEANGLLSGSPIGIALATAGKVALPVLTRGMKKEDRAVVLKTTTSMYAGAAVWNLCLIPGPHWSVCAVAALGTGITLWQRAGRKIEQESITAPEPDAQIAAVSPALAP